MEINQITEYAKFMNCQSDVFDWIEKRLAAHLKDNKPDQTEIEHIIDYLASDKRPKRLSKMSYEQAKNNTDKWNKALIKKGKNITELEGDVELIKDFGDGFRIVKLVGESAYKREGFLMRHCVASYFGSNKEIYSLRDAKNMPHCTMEKNQQIKGKGNGSINPKYISYVVAFLEQTGQSVGDNEMKNLGYVNVERIKDKLCQNKNHFYGGKYLYLQDKWIDIEGKEYCELDIWDFKDLVSVEASTTNILVNINFNIADFLRTAIDVLLRMTSSIRIGSSGNYAQIGSSGDSARIGSSGNSAQIGNSGNYAQIGSSGDSARIGSSGDYAQIGNSGDSARIGSSGDSARIGSSGNSAQIGSSGNYARIGSSGNYARIGSSGDSARIGSSGDSARIGSSGNYARIGSSGDSARIGSSGNSAQIGSSGNYARIDVSGEKSIAALVGYESMGKSNKDGCLAISWFDEKNQRPRLSVGYVGENIKENVWYKVDSNGNFEEV